MINNYLKIAFRNIIKHKTISIINISGLAIGIACCILIMLYIKNEFNYDRFNINDGRIYRVVADWKREGKTVRSWATGPQIGQALKQEFPEIEQTVRVNLPWGKVLVKNSNDTFYEDQFYYADPNFFKVFSYNLLEGNSSTALNEINSVIIDEEHSLKYFGTVNSIDKTLSIEINGKITDFRITGVLDKIPGPSHLTPHFIIPFQNIGQNLLSAYWNFGYSTYLLLKKGSSSAKLESELPNFVATKVPAFDSEKPALHLQPLTDIHFHSYSLNDASKLNPEIIVYLFSILALFIILLACINFINLTTARYRDRFKEITIRKVVGAKKNQLIKQFLSESFLMTAISLIISLFLAELFLPVFNNLSGQTLNLNFETDSTLLASIIVMAILVGFLSGIYPAFFLSRLKPVEEIENKSNRIITFRKGLVITQFVVSIILTIGTVVVYSQLEYMKNKSLGFDKENVIELKLNSNILQKAGGVIKNEILFNPDVLNASLASAFPYNEDLWRTTVKREGGSRKDEKIVYTYETDYDYLKTLKTQMLAGRDFSKRFSTDSSSFIINEAAVKEFGWNSPEDAINKRISWLGNDYNNPPTGPIIGVVKDFNYKSLHEKVSPAVFHITSGPFQVIAVRTRKNTSSNLLKSFSYIFKKIDSSHPFEFSFMDEDVNAEYKPTERLENIFTIFSLLALFIACMGLFGLVYFITEQKTKEIGIRKVLGASVAQIIYLLTKDLFMMVLIANIIAWPFAYYIMNKWLHVFAYRISVTFWDFLLSGIVAIMLALLTMCIHAVKAATANPVKSLKYE